jgi:2-C-methyl-D-erythritol 4-phosphate cytidylyltransferase
MPDIKKYLVLVAGGKGLRMGNAVPKQFLPLHGSPVLTHSIRAFINALPDIHIILVLPPDQLSYAQIVLMPLKRMVDTTIVAGGATRFHSVKNGLNAITGDGIVFVHDGARPLASKALILRCLDGATKQGTAIPVIKVAESMRRVDGDTSVMVDREQMRLVQTPQTFRTNLIIPAFEQQYQSGFTDEASVYEAFGGSVHLVEGERMNIKVTTPEDMIIAEAMMGAL